jgi:hypothetical protein
MVYIKSPETTDNTNIQISNSMLKVGNARGL